MIIHLEPRFLGASSDLPESSDGPPSTLSYSVLLQVGFTEPPMSPSKLVSSYLTVSPLPQKTKVSRGGLLSVALSFPSPGLGVTQHLALRSSDFPLPRLPAKRQERSSDHLTYSILFAPSDIFLYLPLADHDLWPRWPVDPPVGSVHGPHGE